MTDDAEALSTPQSVPGSVAALQELVDALILVDIAGSIESDDRPLDAEYRAGVQDLVSAEMKRDGSAPDLHAVLTAALQKWAEDH